MIGELWLDVTSKCSGPDEKAVCKKYCVRIPDYSKPIGPELTLFEITKLRNDLKPKKVTLSGGEPTERNDLDKIVRIFRDSDLGVVTNGRDISELIKMKGINRIQYTPHLDDLSELDIEKVRLLRDTFDKFSLYVIVTKKNIYTVDQLCANLEGILTLNASNQQINFHPIIPLRHVPQEYILHSDDSDKLDLSNYNMPTDEEYLENTLFGGAVPTDCTKTLPVRADGEVGLCIGFYGSFSFGNVRDDVELAIARRLAFMWTMDEEGRRHRTLPKIRQGKDRYIINCSVQLENLFLDHPRIWKPIMKKINAANPVDLKREILSTS